jgi:putative membrane protein
MTLADLPVVNAGLNGLSAAFLTAGYILVRRGNTRAHRNCMVGALVASTLFLISYLAYHGYVAYVLQRGPTRFLDPAWFRPIYLWILGTHTVLAMVILPMVFVTVWRAWQRQYEKHRVIARWTLPLWMYVSLTGVLIYLLLYQIFPQHP